MTTRYPSLYQINTRVWLRRLARERDGDDLTSRWLYIDQAAWQINVFEVQIVGV